MEDIYKLYNVCSYEELVETLFNAWTITNDIDEDYADIGNVLEWLLDADLWTDKDRILINSLSGNEIVELAIDIVDMVKEKLINENIHCGI